MDALLFEYYPTSSSSYLLSLGVLNRRTLTRKTLIKSPMNYIQAAAKPTYVDHKPDTKDRRDGHKLEWVVVY
jgi:hypothetical protein